MQNKKYRVTCEGKFLGHYHAKNEEEAIEKAVSRNSEYHPEILDKSFTTFATKERL